MTIDDAYKELNAKEYMTDDELKNLYRKMMKQYHPDNFTQYGDETAQQLAEEKSKQINEAYTVICDYRKNNAHLNYTQQTTQTYTQTHTQSTQSQQRTRTQNNNRNSGRAQNYDYEREYNPEYTRHRNTEQWQNNQEKQYYGNPHKPRSHDNDFEENYIRKHYNPNAGTPQRIFMKYVLNVLMGITFGLLWILFILGNLICNTFSYPLMMLACAANVLNVGLYVFKFYETKIFIWILVIAVVVLLLPTIFNALSKYIIKGINWIGNFISIPAELW